MATKLKMAADQNMAFCFSTGFLAYRGTSSASSSGVSHPASSKVDLGLWTNNASVSVSLGTACHVRFTLNRIVRQVAIFDNWSSLPYSLKDLWVVLLLTQNPLNLLCAKFSVIRVLVPFGSGSTALLPLDFKVKH